MKAIVYQAPRQFDDSDVPDHPSEDYSSDSLGQP